MSSGCRATSRGRFDNLGPQTKTLLGSLEAVTSSLGNNSTGLSVLQALVLVTHHLNPFLAKPGQKSGQNDQRVKVKSCPNKPVYGTVHPCRRYQKVWYGAQCPCDAMIGRKRRNRPSSVICQATANEISRAEKEFIHPKGEISSIATMVKAKTTSIWRL